MSDFDHRPGRCWERRNGLCERALMRYHERSAVLGRLDFATG